MIDVGWQTQLVCSSLWLPAIHSIGAVVVKVVSLGILLVSVPAGSKTHKLLVPWTTNTNIQPHTTKVC